MADRRLASYITLARGLAGHETRPANGVLDCKGPLSGTIAPNILTEVNKKVKLAAAGQKKNQGLYLSFTCT